MRTASQVAAAIEHTLLRPEARAAEIDRLCDEAARFGFHGVCVNSAFVSRAANRLRSSTLARAADDRLVSRPTPVVVSVAGFPLGASSLFAKVEEARRAVGDGAGEIDMVANLGALLDADARLVRSEIEALARVVHAVPGGVLKVILETAALPEPAIVLGCRCAAEGEADFVKTSTGFHPAGGATVEAVRFLHRHAAPIRVKAAGGIRTAEAAVAMLDAGAARIGTSAGVVILGELGVDV
ncbi:MAG: deoxyribose-phosphate aldolase [Planctomycetota bacterium]